jgi:hypothetical protein
MECKIESKLIQKSDNENRKLVMENSSKSESCYYDNQFVPKFSGEITLTDQISSSKSKSRRGKSNRVKPELINQYKIEAELG